jgi:hypothetical protein
MPGIALLVISVKVKRECELVGGALIERREPVQDAEIVDAREVPTHAMMAT